MIVNYQSLFWAICLSISTFFASAQVKVGNNSTPAHSSAALEIESTTKGVLTPRMTTTQRDAISNPAIGLIIYNTDESCLQINDGTTTVPSWICISGSSNVVNLSSNGTSVISSFGNANCDDPSNGEILGTLIESETVNSVSMELYADVSTIGTYSIKAYYVGVLFQANGTFSTTGCQKITLNASGTPNAHGRFFWATNTVPFGRASADVLVSDAPTILLAILEDSDSPDGANNADGTPVSLSQLQDLPLNDLNPSYLTAYQAAIQAETGFSNPPTISEIQSVINAVNSSLLTILTQIGVEANDPNTLSVVTSSELASLSLTNTVEADYEKAYQYYIENNPCDFSSPATIDEVDNMLLTVNAAVLAILTQIGDEADDPNTTPSVISAAELAQLGIAGVKSEYQNAYQIYIDENPSNFSSPATIAEVETMIADVNTSVDLILAQVGNEANDNTTASSVTASQLQSLGLSNVNDDYITAYQYFINTNPAPAITDPATIAQLQAMIEAVNSSVSPILAQIGNEANDGTVPSVVTFAQLEVLGLNDLEEDYLDAYRNYIEDNPSAFSDPATVSEVQAMVDAVNAIIVPILAQIGDEANDSGKPSSVTAAELISIGIVGVDPNIIAIYHEFLDANLNNAISDPATIAEVQAVVDAMNLAAPTSNGTALIASFSGVTPCDNTTSASITGALKEGDQVTSNETMVFYADVTNTGSYDIEAEANGVTFSGSGTFSSTGCQLVTLTASGTPSSSGNTTWTTNTTPSISAEVVVATAYTMPSGITLANDQIFFVYSCFDNNYLPFTFPTGPATTGSSSPNSSTDDPIDIQGIIPEDGITVFIPVTVAANASGTFDPFSATVVVPSSMAEDGISRTIELSWGNFQFDSDTRVLPCTIKAIGGDLLVKKLDINEGIGDDLLGVELGTFTYPSGANAVSSFSLRAKPGITDRNFATKVGNDYKWLFLYQEVTGSAGRTWLNHNLGANYCDLNQPNAAPAAVASNASDHRGFGSMFQAFRPADGHELADWSSSTTGTFSNITSNKLTDPVQTNSDEYFTTPLQSAEESWYTGDLTSLNLWEPFGAGGTNNPCPLGFRLPSWDELNAEIANPNNLNLVSAPNRTNNGSINTTNSGLWSTTFNVFTTPNSLEVNFNIAQSSSPGIWQGGGSNIVRGLPIRCIRD